MSNTSLLELLHLGHNHFTGSIPRTLARLTRLRRVSFSSNLIEDDIDFISSFVNSTNLRSLQVEGNLFTGSLPDSIDNLFEGPIPNELGSLRNLEALDLSYNRLFGAIPNSLKSCLNLHLLHLGSNLLEGEIPSALSSLMGLQNLDLSRNNLSGPIPAFLTKLNLEKLNLSFNRLQGEVPAEGIFGNMTSISIDGNRDLCGGILELRVHPCPPVNSRKKGLSTLLKILIPIFAAGAICLLPFGVYTCKQNVLWKNVTQSLPSFTGVKIMRLSYADLLKATGGFSPTSMVGFGRHASVYKGILDDGHMEIAVKVLNLSVRGASRSFIGIREYGMSCPVSMQGDAYSYGIVLLERFTNKRPTDDVLEDHVNLHCFVSTALPGQVMEVVDPQFQTHMKNDKIKDCLVSVLSIGVSCSKEMPIDRMSMTDAVFELHKIQKLLSS